MSTLFISAPGALNPNEINRHQNQNGIISSATTKPNPQVTAALISSMTTKLETVTVVPPIKQHHVIVVGAGISGLRAASVLQRHGIGVTVLEGRADRIGGRICTSRRDGKPARDIGKLT